MDEIFFEKITRIDHQMECDNKKEEKHRMRPDKGVSYNREASNINMRQTPEAVFAARFFALCMTNSVWCNIHGLFRVFVEKLILQKPSTVEVD